MSTELLDEIIDAAGSLVNEGIDIVANSDEAKTVAKAGAAIAVIWAKYMISEGKDPVAELNAMMASAEEAGEATFNLRYPPKA